MPSHMTRNVLDDPKNNDTQRFLGMLTYLSQFIPQLADKAHTLRSLIKKDIPWTWDATYQDSFDTLKREISEDACLRYYDRNDDINLEVDASQKGLGCALIQKGKPVAFGSKTLTDCQSRYSNIEREMLAVVYGIQRYHTYLYARPFTVITDHKPLVNITAKPIHTAPPRLQSMLMLIQGYRFTVKYRPGEQMILADSLSRSPNPHNKEEIDFDLRVDGVKMEIDHRPIELINFPPYKQDLLREETIKDPVLNALKEVIHTGWPDSINLLPTDLRPYWSFRETLAIEAGIIFKGRQVIIPKSMQEDILEQLHQGHQGIEKTRKLARDTVYWININRQIDLLCKACEACQQLQQTNMREPLITHKIPAKPWQYISSDMFECEGKSFLITVDRYSKYPLVDVMTRTTSYEVAEKIKFYCSLFGRPDEIMTDNGPQYSGQAFKQFTKDWNISHVTSSPNYARSNGFIERHVKHIKPIIKKTIKCKQDIQQALLIIRATPIDSKVPSPAELLFGRPIATQLPHHEDISTDENREWLQKQNHNMKEYHDQTSRKSELPPMHQGQQVRILDKVQKTWCPGTILEKCADEPRSYVVETPNGTKLRRNRSHLRELVTKTKEKTVQFQIGENPTTNPPQVETELPTPFQEKSTRSLEKDTRGSTGLTTRSGRIIRRPAKLSD